MTTRRRLDAELVRRGLARSREQAAELVNAGLVLVSGSVATKPATQVDAAAPVVVKDSDTGPVWVSRAAHKLLGALERFGPLGLEVADRLALDAGMSTGGFSQVLLAHGVRHVTGVDVGYGQVAWVVRQDPRVTVIERTNIRELKLDSLAYQPNLVVGDLSFISLRIVLPALISVSDAAADYLLLVKPQFEVGRENVGTGGVVRDPELRASAVSEVAASAWSLGLGVSGVVASPLPGPSGNVEYVLWLRAGAPAPDSAEIRKAVEEGPT